MQLLAASWLRTPRATLPQGDAELCRLAGCTPDEWQSVKHKVLERFELRDGVLVNPRLAREAELADNRGESGRLGAERRWQTDGKPHGKTMANGMANRMANAWQNDGKAEGRGQMAEVREKGKGRTDLLPQEKTALPFASEAANCPLPASEMHREDARKLCISRLMQAGIEANEAIRLAERADCDHRLIEHGVLELGKMRKERRLKKPPLAFMRAWVKSGGTVGSEQ